MIPAQVDWRTRFAHKPVCADTRPRLWHLGPLYVCRGCVALWSGVVVGSALVLAATPRAWVGAVLLVGALTFVPALALGPIVEHLQMMAM